MDATPDSLESLRKALVQRHAQRSQPPRASGLVRDPAAPFPPLSLRRRLVPSQAAWGACRVVVGV